MKSEQLTETAQEFRKMAIEAEDEGRTEEAEMWEWLAWSYWAEAAG